jgi:hypothetical protein
MGWLSFDGEIDVGRLPYPAGCNVGRQMSNVGHFRLKTALPMHQAVTLVAVRLALTDAQREKLRAPAGTGRHLLPALGSVHAPRPGGGQHAGPGTLADAAPAAAQQLQETLAIVAQQFGGYAFNAREEEVPVLAVIPTLSNCL